MKFLFEIDSTLGVPIYQQLVDKVRTAVKKGTLTPGQKLPTVQEMADTLSIARGTIKRAYDELEHQGFLEKVQGRGTFIRYQPAASGSRKEQAMAAIDSLLDRLEDMGFSNTEIDIFLSLRQKERSSQLSGVKVTVVECNPENLSQLCEQLRQIQGIELYSYLLDTIRAYPYKLDEETDLVITTAEHGEYLESVLPERKKLVRIALRLSVNTLAAMVRLEEGECVGILCSSSRFGQLMYRSCCEYGRNLCVRQPEVITPDMDMEAYLRNKDAVLVPANYEKYCTPRAAELLRVYGQEKKLVLCAYEMDEGSALYLEEKLRQLWEEKTG